MKSSKAENIIDLNPPLEDGKTLSPFTYYQPFQSTFDPEFSVATVQPKPSPWATAPQINRWSPGPERPFGGGGGGPWTAGGLLGRRDLRDPGSGLRPSPSGKDPFSGASAPGRGGSEGRSICNSTWLSPPSPKPSFSGRKESQTSNFLGACSQFPLKWEPGFKETTGSGLGRFSAFRTKGAFGPSSEQMGNFDGSLSQPPCYPLMLGPSGKNVGQHFFKTGHSRPMMCNFCKNNKEVPDIYLNHYLYDPETKILSCPVLRKHVCEICGGTGDQAHTLQYCPVNRERGLQSKVPVLLKTRTITNSTGKIRRN